jgi:hypothetical protein
VRGLATFATYPGHVLAISAYGPAPFAGNLALLLGVHGSETALPTSAVLAGLFAPSAALAPTSIGLEKPG